jgi:predicted nuclease of predicted toxin-antitoxin system
VRYLIDENLSPRICPLLIAGGHHATHLCDHGMGRASDPQVLAKAAAEGLTLITADRGDFGRELAFTRAVEPSVVLLRQLPDVVRAADVAALLLANLTPVVASALGAGAVWSVRPRGRNPCPRSGRRPAGLMVAELQHAAPAGQDGVQRWSERDYPAPRGSTSCGTIRAPVPYGRGACRSVAQCM